MSDQSQGPGWWQASDGKWYPPEQAPGYQPPAGAPMPGAGGTDVGSVLSYSWNKFTQNIGEWVVLWLILVAISIVSSIVVNIAAAVGSSTSSGFTTFRFGIFGIIAGVITGGILGILLVALGKGAAMATSGQRVDVGACFKLTTNNIVAGLIFGVIYGLLNSLCCLFGIAAILFLGFVPVLSALDDKGADALGESVSLSTSRAGETMVFWLIGWLGIVICFLGAPIAMIGGAYLVKRFRGEPIAA